MILAHQIRLDPTKTQEAYFRCACGTARFTYNWALRAWMDAYDAGGKPSGSSLKVAFNAIRKEQFPWTYDVHRDCTSQAFSNLQTAFVAFFEKYAAHPQFKKRGQHDSFYISNDRIRFNGKNVKLPVLGWVRLREPLRFEGKIRSATVSRVADRWMLAVNVDVGDYKRERSGNAEVGVDLGITTLATLSTGEKIEGPKALRKAQRKLRRLNRWHSRKMKGSANRKKSATKLARLHCHMSDVRNDAIHKLTTRLCRENQAVGMEGLNVKGMIRNHHLALSLSDAAFGEFRRQMVYKSVLFGTDLYLADRWYPSSKKCSCCGFVVDSLPLGVREWVCPACGAYHNRDVNAAVNLEPRNLPRASGEVTPVERKALGRTRKWAAETGFDEAGTCADVLCCTSTGEQVVIG